MQQHEGLGAPFSELFDANFLWTTSSPMRAFEPCKTELHNLLLAGPNIPEIWISCPGVLQLNTAYLQRDAWPKSKDLWFDTSILRDNPMASEMHFHLMISDGT